MKSRGIYEGALQRKRESSLTVGLLFFYIFDFGGGNVSVRDVNVCEIKFNVFHKKDKKRFLLHLFKPLVIKL